MPISQLAGAGIGAGLGLLGNIFGGRPRVAGPDRATLDAMEQWRRMVGYGNTGYGALTGNADDVAKFMNPYDATMNPYWDQMRQSTLSAIGSRATMSGAFGGSRQGVAEGQGLADIAMGQAGQRYGEFGHAMDRAGLVAGMGASANANLFGGGDYLRQIAQARLNGRGSIFGSMLGGAIAGYGLAPTPGAPAGPPTPGVPNIAGGEDMYRQFCAQNPGFCPAGR
jgi:hypothetical protein